MCTYGKEYESNTNIGEVVWSQEVIWERGVLLISDILLSEADLCAYQRKSRGICNIIN